MSKQFALVTEYSELELKNIISAAVGEALQQYDLRATIPLENSQQTSDHLLSRKEVCEILNLSLPTVAKLQKAGKIKAITICGSYRYSKKHITDILNNKNKSGTN